MLLQSTKSDLSAVGHNEIIHKACTHTCSLVMPPPGDQTNIR